MSTPQFLPNGQTTSDDATLTPAETCCDTPQRIRLTNRMVRVSDGVAAYPVHAESLCLQHFFNPDFLASAQPFLVIYFGSLNSFKRVFHRELLRERKIERNF
jgi:hypothetical protein